MPIDRKLLDILCCPATGVPLEPLRRDSLSSLNALIASGELRYVNGDQVEAPLQEALITENGERIYRVDSGIPIMLEERGIAGHVLKNG